MQVTNQPQSLFVCHECDALQRISAIQPGSVVVCVCCGSTLFRNPRGGVERPLALILASAILFIVANIYPIMKVNIAGIEQSVTLTGSAKVFLELGNPVLAAGVWVPCVLIPGLVILGFLYVLCSIHFNVGFPHAKSTLVWVRRFLPFGMMDVFLLGILVALVKLVALADVLLGAGFYAFVALIFVFAAATVSLEMHQLWAGLDKQPGEQLQRGLS